MCGPSGEAACSAGDGPQFAGRSAKASAFFRGGGQGGPGRKALRLSLAAARGCAAFPAPVLFPGPGSGGARHQCRKKLSFLPGCGRFWRTRGNRGGLCKRCITPRLPWITRCTAHGQAVHNGGAVIHSLPTTRTPCYPRQPTKGVIHAFTQPRRRIRHPPKPPVYLAKTRLCPQGGGPRPRPGPGKRASTGAAAQPRARSVPPKELSPKEHGAVTAQ